MKKIISMISILVLIFSLAACSNKNNAAPEPTTQPSSNNSQEAVAKNDKIERYINKDALKNTDNITIVADKTVNDDEYFLLNIKADNIVKDGKVNDAVFSIYSKDSFDINGYYFDINVTSSYYNEKSIPILNWKDNLNLYHKGGGGYEYTKIAEDGCWFLVDVVETFMRKEHKYYIWAKAKNQYIKIDLNKNEVKNESDAYERYNYAKEHFTLATVKTVKKANNDVIWNVPDLKTVTLIDEDQATKLAKDWTFFQDLLLKKYKDNGLNILSLSNILESYISENEIGSYFSSESKTSNAKLTRDCYYLHIKTIDDGDSYDMGKVEKEFTIGTTKFKITEIDDLESKGKVKAKTELGNEYDITIRFPGYVYEEIDTDLIQKYTEYFFTAK